MADGVPGRQHLTGHRLRDYDHAIALLCESRLSQGLSQDQVAERVGLSQTAVGRILDGIGGRTLWRLFAIADALGYDLALIPREDTPQLGMHSNGARRCSQPGHGTLGCACPETVNPREDTDA